MTYRILFDSGQSVVVDSDDAPDLSGSDAAWVLVKSPRADVLFPVRRVVCVIKDKRASESSGSVARSRPEA